MELRRLKYFVAVAEQLSFRRAAEQLYVAQPAVSEQIRKLEDELGVRLLDRTQRKVSLTDAGAALLSEAAHVLSSAETACMAARAARDRAISRLRVGYMPASLPACIPHAVRRVTAEMASVVTSLEPGRGTELVEQVRDERLDAAVVTLPAATAGLCVTQLGTEHALAALPVTHRQAIYPALRLDRIAPESIVVLKREANRPFYDAVVSACRAAGLAPNLIEMSDQHLERLLLAVASGVGMALVPESVAERYLAPGVRFVALEGPQPAVATAVVTRRDSTHLATAAFLQALTRTHRSRQVPAAEVSQPTAA